MGVRMTEALAELGKPAPGAVVFKDRTAEFGGAPPPLEGSTPPMVSNGLQFDGRVLALLGWRAAVHLRGRRGGSRVCPAILLRLLHRWGRSHLVWAGP